MLQFTEDPETLKDSPLPLPQRPALDLVAADEFVHRLEQPVVEHRNLPEVRIPDTMIEDPSRDTLFDDPGASAILVLIDLRPALSLQLEERAQGGRPAENPGE